MAFEVLPAKLKLRVSFLSEEFNTTFLYSEMRKRYKGKEIIKKCCSINIPY